MASPISRRPSGLLDLLLTQQQGKNPSVLGESVQPVIDLTEMYATDRLTIETLNRTYTAIAQTTNFDVPPGETWRLFGVGGFFTFATIDQHLSVAVSLQRIPNATHHVGQLVGPTEPLTATGKATIGYEFANPLWIPPGTRIQLSCNDLDLDGQASIVAVHTVMFTRMEV